MTDRFFPGLPLRWLLAWMAVWMLWPCARADEAYRLQGDLGLALYRTPAITRSNDRANLVLPYVYADYGPFYGRVDTFGYKMLPLGAGHLELSARVSTEMYRSLQYGVGRRTSPVPVGFGTYQETAYGAFFLYGFHDLTSRGTLAEGTYAAAVNVGAAVWYPEFGLEYRSGRYIRHLYGLGPVGAAVTGLPVYAGSSSVTPSLALAGEYPLGHQMKLTWMVKRRWLDRGYTDSPLVDTKTQTSALIGLVRNFQ